MPDVSPFRAVRYDVARVGELSNVVAPPYDVIDPGLQNKLYDASPFNVIRLELNRAEPGDNAATGRYARAAGFGKADRDGLRGGLRTMLALAYVVHLLANELARLGAGSSALALVAPRAAQCLSFRHVRLFAQRRASGRVG